MRPESCPEPRTRRGVEWAAVALAMCLPATAAFTYLVLLPGTSFAQGLYALTKLFLLAWPLVAALAIERVPGSALRPDLAAAARALPLGFGVGCVLAGGILATFFLSPLGAYLSTFTPVVRAKAAEMGLREHYVAFACFLALVHSLLEEYYWRWYVFGRLDRLVPTRVAVPLAAAAFAAHHYVLLASFFPAVATAAFGTGVGIGGALWCGLVRRQRSLAGAWVSHALVDAALLFIGHRLLAG
ncbi:MAG: CPBP family intramembrane metalloprotease [Planctomycetes bacterium]|nr:CPBP family intramembrane metalloprotease [Planctomycetota bacterium]